MRHSERHGEPARRAQAFLPSRAGPAPGANDVPPVGGDPSAERPSQLYSARAFEQHRNRNRRPFRHPFGDSLIGFLAVCLEARRYLSSRISKDTNRVDALNATAVSS